MATVSCDVLVIGSGAAGRATAITANQFGCDVLVVEKEVVFGGTTARSGGWLWVPLNPLARQAGVSDSLARARSYIPHQAGNHCDERRVADVLENAGPTDGILDGNTAMTFAFGKGYWDYHHARPVGVDAG